MILNIYYFVAAVIRPPIPEETRPPPLPSNPCNPPPCGANAICQVVSGAAKCQCMPNMIGTAPNCRPECIVSSDCPSAQTCVNRKCVDPCPGSCGTNAVCRVVNHTPLCNCADGFTGDAFSSCQPVPIKGKSENLIFFLFGSLIGVWDSVLFFNRRCLYASQRMTLDHVATIFT